MTHAAINLSSVGLELRLAGSPRTDAAAELRHFGAAAGESRKQVLQLRKFHLKLTLTRAGMAREDVEN